MKFDTHVHNACMHTVREDKEVHEYVAKLCYEKCRT